MRSRLAVIATALSLFIFFSYVLLPSRSASQSPIAAAPPSSPATKSPSSHDQDRAREPLPHVDSKLLSGGTIMPHLGNETIKKELGRASWKLFHTTLARFPEKPTADEREALSSYLHLFARLYPCGECAAHFQKLLADFPPQTSSRDVASQWGCHVHNQVNERLRKKQFDCNTVAKAYQCGCGEKEKGGKKGEGKEGKKAEKEGGDKKNKPADALEENVKKSHSKVEIERSGTMNGG